MFEPRPTDELITIPATVLDYLRKKHQTIVNCYKDEDGKFSESCGLIAIDIAELLQQEMLEPNIMIIPGQIQNHGIDLVPIIFKGKIEPWGAHQVCCCNGLAFDPILGFPIAIKDYTRAVFGEEISMRIVITSEEIREILRRRMKKHTG